MEKTDREFYEKSDAFDATYDAWIDGPNVVIQLAWVGEKESEGDVKGKAVYNKLNAFFNECGVPFTSWFRFDTASILSTRNWGHFFLDNPTRVCKRCNDRLNDNEETTNIYIFRSILLCGMLWNGT
jgi:hypothetical protein